MFTPVALFTPQRSKCGFTCCTAAVVAVYFCLLLLLQQLLLYSCHCSSCCYTAIAAATRVWEPVGGITAALTPHGPGTEEWGVNSIYTVCPSLCTRQWRKCCSTSTACVCRAVAQMLLYLHRLCVQGSGANAALPPPPVCAGQWRMTLMLDKPKAVRQFVMQSVAATIECCNDIYCFLSRTDR